MIKTYPELCILVQKYFLVEVKTVENVTELVEGFDEEINGLSTYELGIVIKILEGFENFPMFRDIFFIKHGTNSLRNLFYKKLAYEQNYEGK